MPQPDPYDRLTRFTGSEAGKATAQLGVNLDKEFDEARLTIEQTRTNLGIIQRDDTKLANKTVHAEALDDTVLALLDAGAFSLNGSWSIGKVLAVGNIVEYSGALYLALTAHTAADFTADLAAKKIIGPIFDPDQVSGLVALLASTSGAAQVGTAGGVTVEAALALKASLSALSASSGSTLFSFLQAGTGATSRTGQSKLRDVVSPEDFGAIGDGVTDDYAAFLNALQSGRAVNGNGRTYAISTSLAPSSFKALRNCTLKWVNTTAMAQQAYLLSLIGLDDVLVENVNFDLGSVADTGGADDSARGGLRITSTNQNVVFINRPRVIGCSVTGSGNGTGIFVRSANYPEVRGNTVYTRRVAATPDPSNDCQNSIDVSYCIQPRVTGNIVNDCQTRLTGSYAYRFARGMVAVGNRNGTWTGNTISFVDQGMDFSGGVISGSADTTGNIGCTVSGNTITDVTTWGIKHANAFRNGTTFGNTITRFGAAAIVYSPTSSGTPPLDPKFNTQENRCFGNVIDDATTAFGFSGRSGIAIITSNPGYPRGIKVYDNTILNTAGGTALLYGVYDEVVYDGSSTQLNEQWGNRIVGAQTAQIFGFRAWRTILKGSNSQSIANNTATNLLWDTEIEDGPNGHAANDHTITAKVAGTYRINANISWAGNATGYRSINLLVNGGSVAGGQFTTTPNSGVSTCVGGQMVVKLNAGDGVRIEAIQTSGGALNAQLALSLFSMELIELA